MARAEFPAVDSLIRSALSDLPSFYTPAVAEVGCQIPPIGTPSPMAPLHSPLNLSGVHPIRLVLEFGARDLPFYPTPYDPFITAIMLPMEYFFRGRRNAGVFPPLGCLVSHCS